MVLRLYAPPFLMRLIVGIRLQNFYLKSVQADTSCTGTRYGTIGTYSRAVENQVIFEGSRKLRNLPPLCTLLPNMSKIDKKTDDRGRLKVNESTCVASYHLVSNRAQKEQDATTIRFQR
jgi:hypothetical protein